MIFLKHKELKVLRENKVVDFSLLKDVKSLVKEISDIDSKIKDESLSNSYKGAAFEIFVEYFINKLGATNDIGIVDYEPAQTLTDYGVDGVGKGLDDKPATVQIKFRSNPNDDNTYEEIAKFFMQSINSYGVETKNAKNMLFVSTAFRLNQHAISNYGGRFLGLNQLERIIGEVNNPFWNGFRDSWNDSQPLGERVHKKRFEHQERMFEAGKRLLDSSSEHRGWIGCGTGGGKTISMSDIAELYLQDKDVVVVAAPRIALSEQLKKEFHNNRSIEYDRLLFHSGGKEEIEFWKGDLTQIQNSTTKVEDLKDFALKSGKKIIFTTYHSSLKLGETLEKLEVKFLYLADECHNLVSADRSKILDQIKFDKFVGLTGTAKNDRLGYGMQNYSRWGRCICEVTPAELFQNGVTVPPRGYFLKILDSGENQEFEIDSVDKLVRSFKDEIYPDRPVKIVVTCSGVNQAHRMADENVLDGLSSFEKYVVTSNQKLMGNRKRESELKRFAESTTDAVIFHYDMLGEGIDVPGVTAVLPFRSLDNVRIIQNVGRANRLLPEDREKLRKGELDVSTRTDWSKPYAWVLCPYTETDPESNYTYQNVLKILSELRSKDFNFSVEEYMYVGKPTSAKEKDDIEKYDAEENQLTQSIIKDLEFYQEEEEKIIAATCKKKAKALVEVKYSLPEVDHLWLESQPDPFNF